MVGPIGAFGADRAFAEGRQEHRVHVVSQRPELLARLEFDREEGIGVLNNGVEGPRVNPS